MEKLKENGGKLPEPARLAIQYATESMTDQQCLDVVDYVERWNPNGARYKKDKRVSVGEDGGLVLYKCIQEHTSQEDRRPSINTAALWSRIDAAHAGTLADPIPWKTNMQPEAGKYYVEGELVAKCIEDPGQPLYNALAELCPGRYFEVAEGYKEYNRDQGKTGSGLLFWPENGGASERYPVRNLYDSTSCTAYIYCMAAEAAEKGQGRQQPGNHAAPAGAVD